RSCFCVATAVLVHSCSCRWLAKPPFAATRAASDGALRTTSIRWPTVTLGRGPPTRPRHDDACAAGEPWGAPPVAKPATSNAAAATAMTATGASLSASEALRIGIDRKITAD